MKMSQKYDRGSKPFNNNKNIFFFFYFELLIYDFAAC